ncbi:MAG: PHP domain-containing protein, partial [Phycisphaerae bacterium]
MRYQNPFAIDGRWFRGNTHSHTTGSDGALSLEQRCAAYRQAGYDFLVITDHDVVGPAEPIDLDGLLAIPGAELHPPNPCGG